MKRKTRGTALPMPQGIALGTIVSILMTLGASALIAHLVLTEKMTESAIGYGAMAVVLLSSAAGSLIAMARIKHRQLLVCLMSGCCYYLMLLCMTAMFFGGQYQGMGVTALLVFAGAGSVAMLGLRGEGGTAKRRKKSVNRKLVQN